jgi:hypothetical protein
LEFEIRGIMTEIHVISFFGNWAVMIPGRDTPVSTHNLKDDAIRIATQLSKRHNSKVVIKDETGEDESK